MSGVSVLQHFEAYQRARVTFVQAVAEAATRPQNIEVMQNAGVMQLLRPLLLDNVSFTPISVKVKVQVISLVGDSRRPNLSPLCDKNPSWESVLRLSRRGRIHRICARTPTKIFHFQS